MRIRKVNKYCLSKEQEIVWIGTLYFRHIISILIPIHPLQSSLASSLVYPCLPLGLCHEVESSLHWTSIYCLHSILSLFPCAPSQPFIPSTDSIVAFTLPGLFLFSHNFISHNTFCFPYDLHANLLCFLLFNFIILDLGRDKHRPSKVKGLSYTGLLVTRTCTRTSWQESRVQGKRAESPSK